MKILSNKQKDELLKRVAACQIIANNYVDNIEAHTKITENLADIAIEIGGCEGATKVQGTVLKYCKGGHQND